MSHPLEIAFSSSDGVSNRVSYYRGIDSKPCLVVVPAMGVPAQKYLDFIRELSALGYSAATFDLRGLGHSSVRASRQVDFGYHHIISKDFPAAIAALKTRIPSTNIVFIGHSLGGQLACLYMSLNPEVSDHIVLNASCTVDYRGWPAPKNLGLLAFTQICPPIARLLGYFPGNRLGFAGVEARTVMRDWAKNARSGKYVLQHSDVDFEARLAALSARVLAINYADDDLSPLPATQRLIDKLGSDDVQYRSLSANEIAQRKANHFSWMRSPKIIADTIDRWLQKSNQ